MDEVYTYLYDARGNDKEITFTGVESIELKESHLLWVNILRRDEQLIKRVTGRLGLENVPIKAIMNLTERPTLDNFPNYYRFSISSIEQSKSGYLRRIPICYLVGKNFVLTIHDGDIDYFLEFRDREKGETQFGDLDAESFVATLLDLHIVTYFRALEKIEDAVDKLDVDILRKDLRDEDFLKETVRLKSDVAKLRRWLLPHRDVLYALTRSDFSPVAESDSTNDFHRLTQHFENAVDAVETSRDTVLSLFDLYATRSAHKMNIFIKRLTFVTLIVGTLGAVAGVWGMNFEVEYFKTAERGFWLTIGGMGTFTVIMTILAKWFRWL
ncbi:MAG TPA: CorA family divalent cation transporter [Pyrinomonadaceae bacterium]|nr:CorA family divalent cation transporter [Pyrinomonadaceae bacterium]